MKLLTAVIALSLIAAENPIRSRRVLMFHAGYCVPCKAAIRETEEWMRPSGWTFGDTGDCHVQYVDTEKSPELAARFGVEQIPAFVLIDKGEKIEARGYDTTKPVEVRRRVVVELYNRN